MTAVWAGAGVVLALPQLVFAIAHGRGPAYIGTIDAPSIGASVADVVSTSFGHPLLTVMVVLFAVLGALMFFTAPWRRLVTILLCWAVLPTVLAISIALVHPNVLRGRYWIGAVPALAALAAVGVVALGRWAGSLVGRRGGPRWALATALVISAALVGAHGAAQWPAQSRIRLGDGHGEDSRVALAALRRLESATPAPLAITPLTGALVIRAVDPEIFAASVNTTFDLNSRQIWARARPTAQELQRIGTAHTVLWLDHTPTVGTQALGKGSPSTLRALMDQRLPPALRGLGFTIHSVARAGPGWILVTLTR
jgi:hypothetical protein